MERPGAEASEPSLGAPVYSEDAPSERETESSQPAAQAGSVRGDLAAQTREARLLSSDPTEARLTGSIEVQLDQLGTQIHGLQEQLATLIARRNEAVAERASQHVASIVAAAEKSAAHIRASAEKDAATIRKRLLANVEIDVERIRAEAQADAARIRREGDIQAARARERAITEASDQVQAACGGLSTQLQAVAREAIAGVARGAHAESTSPETSRAGGPSPSGTPAGAEGPADRAPESLPQPVPWSPAPSRGKQITNELEDAVDELQKAATALERSLHDLRAIGGEQQPVD